MELQIFRLLGDGNQVESTDCIRTDQQLFWYDFLRDTLIGVVRITNI